MQPIDPSILSILPPIIAIVLALITKEVISSLLLGILIGAFTWSIQSHLGFMSAIDAMFQTMGTVLGDNIKIIIFLSFLGAVVVLVTMSGGAQAYGKWASTKIKSPAIAQLMTGVLGVIIFIDDYFNCLTVGAVMKPITDKYQISRAKLAYFIDSTAAPVCIIAPISSWAAAVGSNLSASKAFDSDMLAFISTIPYNLYALLTITMVIVVAVTHIGYGPMTKFEKLAREGDLDATDTKTEISLEISEKGKVSDLVIPILGLIILSILAMLYTGGFFGGDYNLDLVGAIGNCDSSLSLVFGGFGALIVCFIMFIPRKLIGYSEFFAGITEGVKNMVPANIILTLAWTISSICRDLLQTGVFVSDQVEKSGFPVEFLPVVIFVVAAFLSFSTGTAWGTFGILIPIVIMTIQSSNNPNMMVITLAATLGGSVFGDHCSPISDTTILSSTGAACPHIDHVATQIPYALTVAVCCVIGYLVSAFTDQNVYATLIAGFGSLAIALFLLNKFYPNHENKKHLNKMKELHADS